MDEIKRSILAKKSKEELFSLDRFSFTLDECQEIIDNTRLTKLDRDIANLKVIQCNNYDEIATALHLDKRTVVNHWKDISVGLKLTIVKMFYTGDDLF